MIQLTNVTVSFGDQDLFRDITWNVGLNERVALVGPNGAGKTTLFRIALGLQQPSGGTRTCSRRMRLGYLPQEELAPSTGTVLAEAMTVFADRQAVLEEAEELSRLMAALPPEDPELPAVIERYGELHHRFEGQDGYQLESRAQSVLQGLGFRGDDFGRPVATFSGGWRMRLALAKLLLEEPSYLFLDEPTNHLDIESMDYLESYLREFRGTMVIISHDRYFLDRTVNKIYELELGRFSTYHANYTGYLAEKDKRRELLAKQQQEQDREIEHVREFIGRWKGSYTKRHMVTSREKRLEKLLAARIEIPSGAKSFRLNLPEPPHAGRFLAELRGVTKRYGDRTVFAGADLSLEHGHKLGLVGVNGAGKTTLLKILAGVEPPSAGEKTVSPQAVIAYFAQHTAEMLDPARTVYESVEQVVPRETPGRIRTILGSFLFPGDDVFKKVAVLSGGEKARLALCRTLLLPANLLIMDEPTNHLDLKGKEVLEQALREYRGTVVLVTHDRYIIDQVVDTIVEVADGRVRVFPGNYTDYIWKKQQEGLALAEIPQRNPEDERKGTTAAAAKAAAVKQDWQEAKKQKAQSTAELRRRQRAIAELEERIHGIEQRQKQLESPTGGLADPAVYSDGARMKELMNEFDGNKRELQRLYDRWEHHHSGDGDDA
ncbi:MAG: ABC-F family ATP-binding cassette domain-containing protein [Candidatus Edwardsbacteria bacterium]|jgi:ATP-binding cassette subfamily F protein 3|nr:ABC-F family ATP-binding cassette domain-containing protein [Candidatus Edwardsbacteria bacterium]